MYRLSWILFTANVHTAQKWRKNQDFHVLAIVQHFYTLNFVFKHRGQPLTIL